MKRCLKRRWQRSGLRLDPCHPGLATISQKTTMTERNAGTPSQNHTRAYVQYLGGSDVARASLSRAILC